MGFYNSLQACFTHARAQPLALGRGPRRQDARRPRSGEDIPEWKGTKVKPSQKDTAAAEV